MSLESVPQDHRIVIIKKNKGHHDAPHGGAWKVAYADFVTAMMALFIVLWLMNSSQEVQKVVGGYFVDPAGKGKEIGTGARGAGETVVLKKDDMSKLKEEIHKALQKQEVFRALKNQIQLIITSEGLRIELLENDKGTFFESGRSAPTDKCRELLALLSSQLGQLPNRILIEGHTDSHPFASSGDYTNWELSSDRANSARRLMENHGLRKGQIAQVRGFADQNLRLQNDPENPSNRRVTIIVQYQSLITPLSNASHPHGG